ncbi:hypothetical protein [Nannocystis punicea]|uniref:Right handed beta helix domain-containing protein n=1 Tax=Nannocystis punicea TaxID=2995304 RepID=A0ABY7GWF4_9BACT|nr:hypothetical protein [Nannocystis poenicansa]WAS91316.1 hypothetical protein O0S08_34445 [Nannocystis poenicansa]
MILRRGARWAAAPWVMAASLALGCFYNPTLQDKPGSTSAIDTTDAPSSDTEPSALTSSTTTSATTGTTTSTTTSSSAGSESESATEASSSSSSAGGPECDPNNPKDLACGDLYCVAGQCVGCTSLPAETPCAAVDALAPVCDAASDKCVECTPDDAQLCSGDTPACDPLTNKCVPCTEHAQCPDSACDILEGACFPDEPEAVVYVQGSNVDCQAKTGLSEDSAFCKLTDVPSELPKVTIRLISGTQAPGGLSIDEGKAVAIVKHKSLTPEINGANIIGPTLTVSNSRLYLSSVKLRFASISLVKCTAGRFYAHDTFWEGNNINNALAIDASSCDVSIHRARIARCGAGLKLSGGNLWIENSFILDSGAQGAQQPAFHFLNGAKALITYSTIARNRLINGVSTFACNGDMHEVLVRNSAVVGVAEFVDSECGQGLTFQHSVMYEAVDEDDVNNVMTEWFNAPVEDVYTPKNGPLEDKAMWEEGDPRFDFFMQPIATDKPTFAGARQPL